MKLSQFVKRLFDILVAISVLLLFSPLLLIISLLILLLEGWPIFYISKRYISPNKSIPIIKFRTMVKDATSPKYDLKGRFMKDGYLDIPLDCEVYTGIGRILERTQLVEIWQLLNILFYGISLIGNRPLPLDNIELLKQFPDWEKRFDSPVGITGISQVVGKLNLAPLERLELEILYSKVYNEGNILLCDIIIAVATIKLILFGKVLPLEEAQKLLQRCLK